MEDIDILKLTPDEAMKHHEKGLISDDQANHYINTKQSQGNLLDLEPGDVESLYDGGYITDRQAEKYLEYKESPVSFYAKDILMGIGNGIYDARKELEQTAEEIWGGELYNVDDPGIISGGIELEKTMSTPASVAESLTEFALGFLITRSPLGKASSTAGEIGKSMFASAVTETLFIDERADRLSNLIEKYPDLSNPVTNYLKADPTDDTATAKFKSTLESLSLGAMFDTVFLGFKATRAALRNKHLDDTDAVSQNVDEIIPPSNIDIDETSITEVTKKAEIEDILKLTDDEVTQQADIIFNKINNPKNYVPESNGINWDKIQSTDDFVKLVDTIETTATKNLDVARGGTKQTHEQVKKNAKKYADEFGVDVKMFEKMYTASEDMASKFIYMKASLDSMGESIMKKAQDLTKRKNTASDAEMLEFIDQLKFFGNLQGMVKGVRTNTARTVAAGNIKIGNRAFNLNDIPAEEMADAIGKAGGRTDMLKVIDDFSKVKDPGQRNMLARHLGNMKIGDGLHLYWLNGLLSNPATHKVNLLGNLSVLAADNTSQLLGATGRLLTLDGSGMRSFGHRLAGQWAGLADAFRVYRKDKVTGKRSLEAGTFWTSFAKNEPQLDSLTKYKDGAGSTKEINALPSLFNDRFSSFRQEMKAAASTGNTWLATKLAGKGLAGIAGDALTVATRLLTASDEAFKTVVYRGEVHQQAYEVALSRGLKKGTKEWNEFIAKYIHRPPSADHYTALQRARELTFTEPSKATQAMSKIRSTPYIGYASKYILPFITTPLNIVKTTGRYTPGINLLSKKFRDNVAAGGRRRDLALGQLALGTFVYWKAYEMYNNGTLTGHIDKTKRESFLVNQLPDNAIRNEDGSVSQITRLDPWAQSLGLMADTLHLVEEYELGEMEEADLVKQAILVISNNTLSKTYMQGVSDFVRTFTDDKFNAAHLAYGVASGFVPYSSFQRGLETDKDDVMREAREFENYIYKIIERKKAPMKLDAFGYPIKEMKRAYGIFMTGEPGEVPTLYKELLRVDAYPEQAFPYDKMEYSIATGITGTIKYDLNVRNQMKEEMKKFKVFETLTDIVESKGYQDIKDDATKAKILTDTYNKLKQAAVKQFLETNGLVDEVRNKEIELFTDSMSGKTQLRNKRNNNPSPMIKQILEN